MASTSGGSALVIPVPAIESAVARWRDRFDPSAAAGMPAHITVLYPFLDQSQLGDAVAQELRSLCESHTQPAVTFERTGRFPSLLYLAPEPASSLIQLTQRVVQRWPETPPYGGAFDDVIPHSTVAHGDNDLLDSIEAEVRASLPIRTVLSEVVLFVFDGQRWETRERFPLGSTPA
jgi:2'-5' RNA ligase superfamily